MCGLDINLVMGQAKLDMMIIEIDIIQHINPRPFKGDP